MQHRSIKDSPRHYNLTVNLGIISDYLVHTLNDHFYKGNSMPHERVATLYMYIYIYKSKLKSTSMHFTKQ